VDYLLPGYSRNAFVVRCVVSWPGPHDTHHTKSSPHTLIRLVLTMQTDSPGRRARNLSGASSPHTLIRLVLATHTTHTPHHTHSSPHTLLTTHTNSPGPLSLSCTIPRSPEPHTLRLVLITCGSHRGLVIPHTLIRLVPATQRTTHKFLE